jgi:hypothetical protein
MLNSICRDCGRTCFYRHIKWQILVYGFNRNAFKKHVNPRSILPSLYDVIMLIYVVIVCGFGDPWSWWVCIWRFKIWHDSRPADDHCIRISMFDISPITLHSWAPMWNLESFSYLFPTGFFWRFNEDVPRGNKRDEQYYILRWIAWLPHIGRTIIYKALNRRQSLKLMDYCMANGLIYFHIRLQSHLRGCVELESHYFGFCLSINMLCGISRGLLLIYDFHLGSLLQRRQHCWEIKILEVSGRYFHSDLHS